MPRITRQSLKAQNEVKENIDCELEVTPEKTRANKKRKSPDTSSEKSSSPPKSSRSNSLSPFREAFASNLSITTPKSNKYRSARRALVGNSNFILPGREKEFEELTSYLNDLIEREGSGSLYISGAPGTGKTATLSKIIGLNDFKSKLKIAFINCTSIRSIGAIYKKICSELKLKINVSSSSEKECLAAIEAHFTSSRHKMTLLILDEIDQLCGFGKQQDVLYHIFEWPSIFKSKLILVGIANSLDLTDRTLVRLQSRCELKPRVMHYTAYTKSQIIDIFKSRLEESGVSDLFPPAAIQLLAAKVSAVSGDIRRALNIGKRVVELAELEKRRNSKSIDIGKFEALIESEEKPEEAPKIQLKEVSSVLNSVYGNAQTFGDDDEESFPVQQKILICTLLLLIKHDKNKIVTMGRLHDIFKKVCKSRNILATSLSDFLNICSLVEARGILQISKKKEPRFHQIQLQWDESEISSALADKQLVQQILNERNLLK